MNAYKQILPPVTWFGCKSKLVKKIVRYFPEHRTYVDVFGGSGAVLLGKRPSKVEVYNDINKKMFSLFSVLSDKEKTQELVRRLEFTPYSRDVFDDAIARVHTEPDEIELARLMIVVQRQSHGGCGKQWSYCVDAHSGGYSGSVRRFHAGIERLKTIQKRMRKVQIENLCFSDLLPRYDRSQTLFYLDPPYVPDTRAQKDYYEHEMCVEDHSRLVDILLGLDGMCILSGYRTHVYDPLDQAGWNRVEIDTYTWASRHNRQRVECLWISPNCMKSKEIPIYRDIDGDASLSNRQKAALRIHRYRKQKSEKLIAEAIYSLKRMKKKVTQVAVSRKTGISREHISRYYRHLFQRSI